jgi:conjugal transfer mating pair stabilization protein TraG
VGQQDSGRRRISGERSRLEGLTGEAKGASAEAADEVKEWKPSGQ